MTTTTATTNAHLERGNSNARELEPLLRRGSVDAKLRRGTLGGEDLRVAAANRVEVVLQRLCQRSARDLERLTLTREAALRLCRALRREGKFRLQRDDRGVAHVRFSVRPSERAACD